MIILKRPIITEKSMLLTKSGFYTFEVDKHANKYQIAKVVKNTFNVDVLSVNVINSKGVVKQQRRARKTFTTSPIKKAIVELKQGQKIAIFENESKVEEAVVTTGEGEPQVLKERKDLLRRTKVKVEKSATNQSQGAAPTTQRKVITGK